MASIDTDTSLKRSQLSAPYQIPEFFKVQAQLPPKKVLGQEVKPVTDDSGIIIPYSVLTGLALLNAKGEAIPTSAIYDFISEYFPDCANHLSNSCKSSIRNALCKYDFVAKVSHRRGEGFDWAFDNSKIAKFRRILQLFENRHGDAKTYGLKDISDWPLIRAGLKGLPERQPWRVALPSENSTIEQTPSSFESSSLDADCDLTPDPGSPTYFGIDSSPAPSPRRLPFNVERLYPSKIEVEHNEPRPQLIPEKNPTPIEAATTARIPTPAKVTPQSRALSPKKVPSPVKKSSPTEDKPIASISNSFSGNMPHMPLGTPLCNEPNLALMQSFLPGSFSPINIFSQMSITNPIGLPPLAPPPNTVTPQWMMYMQCLKTHYENMEKLLSSDIKSGRPEVSNIRSKTPVHSL